MAKCGVKNVPKDDLREDEDDRDEEQREDGMKIDEDKRVMRKKMSGRMLLDKMREMEKEGKRKMEERKKEKNKEVAMKRKNKNKEIRNSVGREGESNERNMIDRWVVRERVTKENVGDEKESDTSPPRGS